MKRTLLALLLVTLVAAFLYLKRDDDDEEVLQRLSDKERSVEIESKSDFIQNVNVIQLLGDLRAQRDLQTGRWLIGTENTPDHVLLPFAPIENPPELRDTKASSRPSPDPSGFVGPDACKECHAEKHEGFCKTSHALTSRPMSHENLRDLEAFPKTLISSLDQTDFSLEMRRVADRYIQTIDLAGWRYDVPMDVVTGSGKNGKSFLYWVGNALYQDHASTLTAAERWIHSPGFTGEQFNFSRRVRSTCLECHVTYIETAGDQRLFHQESAVWAVTCERCHGPAKQHVDYYRKHPNQKTDSGGTAVAIVNPNDLSRERQLDLCGQCHSGMFELTKPAFSYRPGDVLADFHKPFEKTSSGAGGIHTSDQRLRMEMSECFKNSEMTCTTCHNPHQFERGDSALFARICQECHQTQDCGKLRQLRLETSDDCVECHMPTSQNMDMADIIDQEFAVTMPDHFIRIDEDASNRFLKK
jgi:Cytochrome c554 and c-prime